MVNGGALQLSIAGGQDRYLTFEATSNFFQSQFISYEDFAIESVKIETNGSTDFRRNCRFKFQNVSELCCGAYIEVIVSSIKAPAAVVPIAAYYSIAWCHAVGIYIFKKIEFSINNSSVATHYPDFIDLYLRLTIPTDKINGYNDLLAEANFTSRYALNHEYVPFQADLDAPQVPPFPTAAGPEKEQFKIMLPLMFWWCTDYTQALPIGILMFSEVYVQVDFEDAVNLYTVFKYDVTVAGDPDITKYRATTLSAVTRPSIVSADMYVDYIFCTDPVRLRLSLKPLFFVIKQVKTNGPYPVKSISESIRFPATMPVVTILFGVREDEATSATYKDYSRWDRFKGNHFDFTPEGGPGVDNSYKVHNIPDSPFNTAVLKIMSNDRFTERDWLYWTRWTTMRANTRMPESRGIGVYHFALYPEKSMASGAINLSRSDNNYLQIKFNNGPGKNYADDTKVGRELACGIGASGVTGMLSLYYIYHNYFFVESGFATVIYAA